MKIGRSDDPEERVNALQTGNEHQLILYRKIETNDGKLEKMLHEHFKSKRIHGEWFSINKDDVDSILNIINFNAANSNETALISSTDTNNNYNNDERNILPSESKVNIEKADITESISQGQNQFLKDIIMYHFLKIKYNLKPFVILTMLQ
jgi:hypothetical protein